MISISLVIITIFILIVLYINKKLTNKTKFTNAKIVKRAEIIKNYLDKHGKITTFNDFKSSITDTDVAEWTDVRDFTDKTELNTIIRALS